MISNKSKIFCRLQRNIRRYLAASNLFKLSISFIAGTITGCVFWYLSAKLNLDFSEFLTVYISPFGAVLVKMLKMVVFPIIFFTLIVGAASLPLKKLGRIGVYLVCFYLLTSIIAAIIGFFIAYAVNPGNNLNIDWLKVTPAVNSHLLKEISSSNKITSVTAFFLEIFDNPVSSLAKGNYIPVITIALLFGFAINVIIENKENPEHVLFLKKFIKALEAINGVIYKIVNWIMKYAPIGVFALSTVNIGIYGPKIIRPYFQIVLSVVLGVTVMLFVVYPILFKLLTKRKYFKFLRSIEAAMITAFVTRSSAATLPVSLKVADEKLKMKREFYRFALPVGSTLNMDGVCIHLPIYIFLAANFFGYEFSCYNTISLIFSTFLVTIGVAGIPGGSLMLLIFILNSMGVNSMGEAVILSIAFGLNPLLDMFETMTNVTGDLTCTYIIADREKLINKLEQLQ